MGSTVNTSGADMYYYEPSSGQWAYYTSTLNSEGFGDVRRVRKPEPPVAPALVETTEPIVVATVPAPVTTPPVSEAKPAEPAVIEPTEAANTITLRGQVTGSDGKTPFGKVIVQEGNFADSVSAASSYSMSLPAAGTYRIQAKAKGYFAVDTVVNIQSPLAQLDFALRPLAVGTTVRLNNVMFQQSTAVLVDESSAALDKVVQMLRDNPSMEIMLTGHTDNQGSSRANIKLSQERVEAVKNYLVSRGIDPARIQGKGFGGTRPVASNANEESRKLNRRVEFTILKQ